MSSFFRDKKLQRVIAYIDGFNLYFGLKSKGWQRYYWLNLRKLVINLLKPYQKLICVKYFTARVSHPPDKQKRQATFIEALETLKDFKIFYGKYQLNPKVCQKCQHQDFVPNEKMTDVYIAVELLTDAFQNHFDTALLISADSDLTPPLNAMKLLFPNKRVIVAFPPNRASQELKKVANACFTIGRRNIARSVFPPEVKKTDGYVLKCPERWKQKLKNDEKKVNNYGLE